MRFLYFLLMVLLSPALMAQNTPFERMMERTLEEKIKMNPGDISTLWKAADESRTSASQKGANVVISDDNNPESEVHAAINPNDSSQIVVSPIGRSGMAGLLCPVYYTNDFGSNWNKSTFENMPTVPGNLSVGGGDPVLAYDDSNRVYFSWIDLSVAGGSLDDAYWGMYWAYSDDNGQTWHYDSTFVIEESRGSLNNMHSFNGPLTDKQWMSVDRYPGSSFYNSLYVSYIEIDVVSQTYTLTLARKRADSAQFDTTKAYLTDSSFSFVQFGSVTIGFNGTVQVSFFGSKDNVNFGIYHTYSDDGGHTFTTPQKIADIQLPQFSAGQQNVSVDGIADARFYPSVYNASSPNSDHIYVSWTANGLTQKDSDGLDIYFAYSADGGDSFSNPVVINDDTSQSAHQYYSAISVSPSGRLDLSWYDRRGDTANIQTHYYIASSNNNGLSFDHNTRITGMATDFSTVGSLNNEFGVGEYNAVLSTEDYIIPIWADGRSNDGNLDIYAAFVHENSLSVERLVSMDKDFQMKELYPNPASQQVTVKIQADRPGDYVIRVLDIQGRQLLQYAEKLSAGLNVLHYNFNELSAGTYFFAVESERNLEVQKLIIQ